MVARSSLTPSLWSLARLCEAAWVVMRSRSGDELLKTVRRRTEVNPLLAVSCIGIFAALKQVSVYVTGHAGRWRPVGALRDTRWGEALQSPSRCRAR